MRNACGNDECGVSTGICDSLTFGSGRLSHNGYWEKPCAPCARAWEKKSPDDTCWPFEGQDIAFQAAGVAQECDEDDIVFGGFGRDFDLILSSG